MTRRTDFQKAITYTGQKIKGPVYISYKIDGVRILYRDGKLVTRNDKQPPGLEIALTQEALDKIKAYGDCEVYTGSFKDVQGMIARNHPDDGCIGADSVYPLVSLDPRLYISTRKEGLVKDEPLIDELMKAAVSLGYEGLVLRTADKWYRVKPHATADVRITGYFEQVDKNKKPKGILGGFDTNYGKVTAFTDEMRKLLWDNPEQYVGQLMEVRYKELYDTGSFRYAVTFLRFRTDKDEESFDTKG
jgi:hypothetical protein